MNKERPILFNADMVRAILEGRKTQTRRIVKDKKVLNIQNENGVWDGLQDAGDFVLDCCPYGKVGDVLWVRETFLPFDLDWRYPGRPHDLKDGPWPNIAYKADQDHDRSDSLKWRPSIHMPRWASRINLEITGVRVERLQDISEEDAKAEGFDYKTYANMGFIGTPKWHYRKFWEQKLNDDSKPDWYGNPWVWVIDFRVKERTGG